MERKKRVRCLRLMALLSFPNYTIDLEPSSRNQVDYHFFVDIRAFTVTMICDCPRASVTSGYPWPRSRGSASI